MKALALATLMILLLLGTAFAQELPVAKPAGAEAFLAGLTGFDEAICGETELAVRMGAKSIGTGKLVVTKAAEGSGGVYQASIKVNIAVGPMNMSMQETAVLDAKFALVSSEVREVNERGGVQEIKHRKITRAEGKWTRVKTEGEETTTLVFPADRPNHESALSAILISRKLAGSPSGDYVFTGVDWGDKDGKPQTEPKSQALTMTLKDAEPATFGDLELEVRTVLGAKESDPETMDFVVGTDGRFISFAPSTAPLTVIDAALPAGKAEPEVVAGTGSPLAAAVLYLKALAGMVPVTDMNKVMDWAAIHADMSAEDPNVAALDVDTLAKVLLGQFSKQAGVVTPEQIELLIPMLTVKEDGETATVTIPGQDASPFKLRKTETGWLITRFPH